MTYARSIEVMPVMHYVVPGTPVPLLRPRINIGGRLFDSQKAQKHEWKLHVEIKHGSLPFYTTPVAIFCYFFFMIPKTSALRAEIMKNTPHTYRPDVDNLVKYVLDCGHGILYRDDSIVHQVYGQKIWSDIARTEFIVIPIDPQMKVHPDDIYLQYSLPRHG